jgi:hypothetical protein
MEGITGVTAMCVRQTRPAADDRLEADLFSFFVNVQDMSETEARAAVMRWAAHIRRRQEKLEG